jgi:FKBP-type peptidyl-prolyl cis-trans isomerase (trigger factor)
VEDKKLRKRNKLLALALCVSLSVTALGGCGSENKETKKTESGKKEEAKKSEDPLIAKAASYVTLAEYKTVELKKSDIDKAVQDKIDQELDTYATYKKIKKGKVKSGDTVNIYYVGRIDGTAFEGGSCTKDKYPNGFDLTIGSKSFIDGFEDGLIGKTVGKTYDINVTFPESYPNNPDLAGKPAVFTVTLNYLRGDKIKSKFDNEFVKKNLTQYESVKDYKEKNRKTIIRSKAIEQVCKSSEVKNYPENKVEEMQTQLDTSISNFLKSQSMTMSDYLKNNSMTQEQYDKELAENAKQDVGNQIVYNAIAQAEKIEVTDEEYQTELNTYLSNYGCKSETELDTAFTTNYGTTAKNIIYNELLYSKVADYLVGNVKEV